MTRYILHGGKTQKKSKKNKQFFQTIIHGQQDLTILCIYFARDNSCWEEKFKEDKEMFEWANPESKHTYILASDDESIFLKQLISADIIYIRGGYTGKLMEKLEKIKDSFAEHTKGKTIVGSSAGAYALSSYFITTINETLDIYPGLGILPVKTIAHYTFRRRKRKKQLKTYRKDLPLYLLREQSFVVFKQ